MIKANGYESAFLYFGLGQGMIVVLAAAFLAAPREQDLAGAQCPAPGPRDYRPLEVLRTPVFWVIT